MFNFLSTKLESLFRLIRKKNKLNKDDLKEVSREVKTILLEADVNFKVVKSFLVSVEEEIEKKELLNKLNVDRQLFAIFHQQLKNFLGKVNIPLTFKKTPKSIMLVGLQGVGKTTTAAKLALYLRKKGAAKKPLLVGLDIYRPAASLQLEILAKEIGVDFFSVPNSKNVKEIAQEALLRARKNVNDLIIYDTAGRLAINEDMIKELETLKQILEPEKIIKVIDSTVGQDAVRDLNIYQRRIGLSGFIFTKLDSDAKGGSVISVSYLTKLPILFFGEGEKLSNLAPFHPERITNRILNIGDIDSLIEDVHQRLDQDKVKNIGEKLARGSFTLEDLMQTLIQISKLGKISKIMKMLPGFGNKINTESLNQGQNRLAVFKVLLSSMTKQERNNPKLLRNPSRKKRIISGSGKTAQDFNSLISSYESITKQMKGFDIKKMMNLRRKF